VGTGACPGVVTGAVCTSSERVADVGEGGPVVLVRPETSPDDLPGMVLAAGLVTSTGGLVSHAALVARELDLPTVVGVTDLVVDEAGGRVRLGTAEVAEGDVITIDGSAGTIHLGTAAQLDPTADEHLARFTAWRDAGPRVTSRPPSPGV
jgi:pyruvate,orthophosphate dikinase